MAWNLHIVGTELQDELEEVLNRFITDLEGIGHKLTGVTLTTDAGQKSLPTAAVASEPVQTVGGVPIDTPPTLPDAAA